MVDLGLSVIVAVIAVYGFYYADATAPGWVGGLVFYVVAFGLLNYLQARGGVELPGWAPRALAKVLRRDTGVAEEEPLPTPKESAERAVRSFIGVDTGDKTLEECIADEIRRAIAADRRRLCTELVPRVLGPAETRQLTKAIEALET